MLSIIANKIDSDLAKDILEKARTKSGVIEISHNFNSLENIKTNIGVVEFMKIFNNYAETYGKITVRIK